MRRVKLFSIRILAISFACTFCHLIHAETATDEPVVLDDIKKSTQRDPQLLNLPIAQAHEGTLRKARNRLLFFRPPHPYELADASGRHLVYVDLSGAVFTPPLSHHLNVPVVIYGKVESTGKDARQIVLRANHLGRR